MSTSYLGLELNSPLVASASPLNRQLDNLRRLDACGAGAVVLPSVFQEQIEREQDIIDALIDRGADPNALESNGMSALHAAAAMKYALDGRPFVRMLLERGADPTIRARDRKTAAEIAEERAGEPGQEKKPFHEIADMLREASRTGR